MAHISEARNLKKLEETPFNPFAPLYISTAILEKCVDSIFQTCSIVHTRVLLDYEIVHYAVYFTRNQNVDKEKRSNQDNQWDI